MQRVKNWAAGQQVPSTDLNNWQDQTAAIFDVALGKNHGRLKLVYAGSGDVTLLSADFVVRGASQSVSVRVAGSATYTPSGLSNNTWYYVYLYNGGTYASPTPAIEVSTTGPEFTLTSKNGDVERTYVGCFRTDGAGTPRPFTMHARRYIWRRSAASGTPFVLGTYTGSGSPHTISLAAVMPPHARVAILRLLIRATGSATVSLQTAGDSAGAYDVASIAPVAGDILADTIELEVGGSSDVTLAVANADVTVECIGFQE